jgi:DNA-3-methyladenine glycosylase
VLLRAAEPVTGIEEMWARRPKATRERDLLAGPARLCQALGLDGSLDGADLVAADRGIALYDDGSPPPDEPLVSRRIGLSAGAELPWRWSAPGSPHLSRRG